MLLISIPGALPSALGWSLEILLSNISGKGLNGCAWSFLSDLGKISLNVGKGAEACLLVLGSEGPLCPTDCADPVTIRLTSGRKDGRHAVYTR